MATTSQFFRMTPAQITRLSPSPSAATVNQMRSDALEMIVFDVGVGEAVLLQRGSAAVLVDAGAGGERQNQKLGNALAGFVLAKGVRLSAIVASHPHLDHLNGLSTLLTSGSNILARKVTYFDNGEPMGKWLTETLGKTLESSGRPDVVHVDEAGSQFRLSKDVTITLFVDGRGRPKPVYKSVFMSLTFRHARFLLTGDAYQAYERALLSSLAAPAMRTDVLKITNHGTRQGTSQRFADWARPRISVASSDASRGHRLAPSVRQRLAAFGRVVDTHTSDGDITVRTDGEWRLLNGMGGVLYEVEIASPGRLRPFLD